MVETAIAITPRGPFSWTAAMDVMGNFSPMTQHWQGSSELVRMTFPLDGSFTPVGVALRFRDGRLHAEVTGSDELRRVERQVARIFSLDHDGTDYPAIGSRDPKVGRLMAALSGLRPLNFTSPYETAAWGVMSQRISMRQAARVKAGLIAEHGAKLRVAGEQVGCFPTPEQLAGVKSVPGLSGEKVERLKGVARAALDGRLDADRLRELGDEAGPASVRDIPGIGPFWSSGIYLRGCGIVDVFPDEPLSIAALGHLHGLGDSPARREVDRLTDAYRPFRMWVCFLLRVAANRGLIEGVSERAGAIRRAAKPVSRRRQGPA
ncbi:MAG: DNA-3-methyladenine glycosylase 2 family protein [Candidatus Dormibacteraeota bacterium]|nr:DNA-3-methyladenine glycosylase 2 family protein [Candidatus Dormibacteraeota bacterium]